MSGSARLRATMIFILECGREESCETDGVGSEYERRCGSCNNLVGRESRRHPRVRFFLGARGPFLQFANNFLRPCSSFAGEISLIAKQCSGLFTALYTGVLCSLHCLAMRRDGPLLQQNEETRTKEDGAIVTQVSSHQCTSHSTLLALFLPATHNSIPNRLTRACLVYQSNPIS
jgi:hypothetical protein